MKFCSVFALALTTLALAACNGVQADQEPLASYNLVERELSADEMTTVAAQYQAEWRGEKLVTMEGAPVLDGPHSNAYIFVPSKESKRSQELLKEGRIVCEGDRFGYRCELMTEPGVYGPMLSSDWKPL